MIVYDRGTMLDIRAPLMLGQFVGFTIGAQESVSGKGVNLSPYHEERATLTTSR